MTEETQVEGTGETVGEAKWSALRELERIQPGLDKAAVRFQVVSEGERGLLGVGYAPARVIATVDPTASVAVATPSAPDDESALAARVRELLERITRDLGINCRVDITEDDETLTAMCSGRDLGMLIGKHGQTIDALQYLVNAIVSRRQEERPKDVVVDAAGYRERRRATLESLAVRSAERAVAERSPVELEPMTAVERRIVHRRLQGRAGIATSSEGSEPHRYVVVRPAPAGGAVPAEPAEGDAGPVG